MKFLFELSLVWAPRKNSYFCGVKVRGYLCGVNHEKKMGVIVNDVELFLVCREKPGYKQVVGVVSKNIF